MSKTLKIYTKTGDKGTTALIGGTRVPKYHEKIEAYGTVDELNAFVGLIRDQKIDKHSKEILLEIQDRLFTMESLLAKDDKKSKITLPDLESADIQKLENEIDNINGTLPKLTSFILPGGNSIVSYCHIARTVCRRTERIVIKLAGNYDVNPLIIQYLNRLSDYFFVLARKFSHDFNVPENLWKPHV